MNKKLFLSMAAASLLMVTSCSQDDFGGSVKPEGSEANVEFNLTLPAGIQSRDYSDGTSATTLQYALYEKDANGDLTLFPATKESIDNAFTDLKRKVSFKLVTGHTYGVVFFAANPAAPYTVDFATDGATLSVDYTGIKANDETLDAFYAYTDFAVTGDVQMEVKLYRPFAQINVGTNDYSDAADLGFEPKVSNMTVSNVYSTLDLVTGDVSDALPDVAYAYNAIATTESFPVIGYEYLDMVYALVDKTKALVDVTFAYATDATGAGEKTRTVTNVPVQRNYRTNIYGQVLTSNVDLYVEIIPDYDGEYNYDELAFAAQIGGTVVLDDDVTLSDVYFDVWKGLVIDLNGHNITMDEKCRGIYVNPGASLVIEGEGTLTSTNGYPIVWADGGDVVVKGGTFNNPQGHSIYVWRGNCKVIVEGGYFCKSVTWPLNIEDSQRAPKTPGVKPIDLIEVRGGTFEEFDPANNASEGAGTNYVPEAFKSEEVELNGVTCYTVVPVDVVVVDGAEAAIEAIDNGATYIKFAPGTYTTKELSQRVNGKLFQDLGNQRFYTGITPEMTFDCYGVTFASSNPAELSGCPTGAVSLNFHGATVKGLTLDKGEGTLAVFGSFIGHFIDCKFIGGVNTENGNGVGTFDNCYFYNEDDSAGSNMAFHNGNIAAGNTMTLNNCEIDGRCDFGVNGELVFNNCTLNVRGEEWGVYGTGTVKFVDCKITNPEKIVSKQGATVIGLN